MPDPVTEKLQRRRVLVKWTLQLKYVGMVFMSVLTASLIVGMDIYYSMLKILIRENPFLAQAATHLSFIILVKILLYLAIMFLISLYISHRFAGPVYRFEKSAQTVSSGDLTHRVSLRTGDELLELQEEFNGMLASLQTMIQKDRRLAASLAARLDEIIKRLPETQAVPGLDRNLESIKSEIGLLTGTFKV